MIKRELVTRPLRTRLRLAVRRSSAGREKPSGEPRARILKIIHGSTVRTAFKEGHHQLAGAHSPDRPHRRTDRRRGRAALGGLQGEYADQLQPAEDALGRQILAQPQQLEAACQAAEELFEAGQEAFPPHPNAEVNLRLPGLGIQLGTRALAEIGDDCHRFADACGL